VLVLGHLVLTPQYGVIGAAVAWSMAIAVDAALTLLRIRVVVAVGLDWRLLGIIGTAALVLVAIPSWVAVRILDLGWLGSGLITMVGGAAYLAVLATRRHEILDTPSSARGEGER
jgi:O-antigen/teichoic acid export membrane protein